MYSQECDRCHKHCSGTIMSKYNTDELCMQCKGDERTLPTYAAANAAEIAAVRQGDYNFAGVGLTADDRNRLAELRRDPNHG